ncbi:twin-arginine translocation signal domain-containing protein, partial [Bradyrhizobium sp. PRIMUS42]|uniref:twin-arginine translocation signal domain-containing protein n=1 Tax=Bradyrhizobium sp. PRIMUS42 TaxID=2908926 RepID=UPI001FF403B3
MMDTPNRRAFLGLAKNAVAAAAIGTIGVRFIAVTEAMPIAPKLGQTDRPSDLLTQAQWGPPPHPGWRRRRPRSRRWV